MNTCEIFVDNKAHERKIKKTTNTCVCIQIDYTNNYAVQMDQIE